MSVAIIILYGMLAIAGASLLSVWAGTLILRVLALRVERNAVRKLRAAWEARRREKQDVASENAGGRNGQDVHVQDPVVQDREPAISAAASELHPARDVTILTIAPMVFAAGLAMTWLVGRWLESHRLLEEKHFYLAMATAVEFVVAGSFLGAWWWLGRTVHPRTCPYCGYDMRATQGSMCTECGRESSEYALTRKRPKRILLVVPVFLVCVSYATVKWEGLRKGWFELVPTTFLIATMEYLPASWVQAAPGSALDETCLGARSERMWRWQYQWLDSRYLDLCASTQDVNTYVSTMAMGLRGRVPPPPHGAIAAEVYKEIGRRLVQGDQYLASQITWMMYGSTADPVVVLMCDAVAPEVIGHLKASFDSSRRNTEIAMTSICLASVSHRDAAIVALDELAHDPQANQGAIGRLARTLAWLERTNIPARRLLDRLTTDPTVRFRMEFVSVYADGYGSVTNTVTVLMQVETDMDAEIASAAWRGLIPHRGSVPAIKSLLKRAADPAQTVTWMVALQSVERSMSDQEWLDVLGSEEWESLLGVAENEATPFEARYVILHQTLNYLCLVKEPLGEFSERVLAAARGLGREKPTFKSGNWMGTIGVWIETLESRLKEHAERGGADGEGTRE